MNEIIFVTHNKGKIATAKKQLQEIDFKVFEYDLEEPRSDDIKYIFIRLVSECNHTCIDIANTSKVYLNSELEKFCEYGYSTKGDKRGIGLSRAKDIIAKHKGTLKIQNKLYETENYICFNICLKNK